MGKTLKHKKYYAISIRPYLLDDSKTILMNKIYYDVLKNIVHHVTSNNIKLDTPNYRQLIGCSKVDLYTHLTHNTTFSISKKIAYIHPYPNPNQYFNYQNTTLITP